MGSDALRTRALSALVMAVPVLAAVYFGAPWFDALLGIAALFMAFEWDRLCAGARQASAKSNDAASWALVATIALVALAAILQAHGLALWLSVGGFAAVFLIARGIERRAPLLQALGALYIGAPFVALVWLRADAQSGLATVLWILAAVWATDTGAMAAGKSIGGPKLAPVISPNKTWAGLLGGMAAAALVGLVFALILHAPVGLAMALSAGLAVVAQAGDLAESMVKRHFGVKDSGAIIPGHGGIFDRVDGLLAAASAWALVLLAADGWRLWS
ncbi:MAG TPA: phosphatidate cytidylyltransferase [Alphaproteobacteria bacterium]|nr:phosphatidate cytidylyltransferase [Alphaproteobacteria bacterium]